MKNGITQRIFWLQQTILYHWKALEKGNRFMLFSKIFAETNTMVISKNPETSNVEIRKKWNNSMNF